MHVKTKIAGVLACVFVTGLTLCAEAAVDPSRRPAGQRSGPPGAGQSGPQAAQIEQQELFENFDKIVELIWTDEEEDAWDRARTDEQKQAFIVAFWLDRDPTPDTEDNEFRDIFLARAAVAEQRFSNEGTEGYRTDRGKFILIYGGNAIIAQERRQARAGDPGAEVADPMAARDRELGGGGASLVWMIDTSINPYLEDKERVEFASYQSVYRRTTGGIELSQEAFLANRDVQEFFAARRADPNAPMFQTTAVRAGEAEAAVGPAATPISSAMQQLMEEGVTRDDLGLRFDTAFFPAPENATYTIVAFEVDKEGLTLASEGVEGPAPMKAFGFVLRQDPEAGEQLVHQMNMPFSVDPGEGTPESSRTRSFGLTLPPGLYRLAWGVIDDSSQRITTRSESVDVPSYAVGGMLLTSVLLYKPPMQRQADALDINKLYEGVRIGSIQMDLDIDRVFERNDTLEVLFFVIGASADPASQQPRLEVDLKILEANTDVSIAALPTQTLNYAAIGQQIPLAQVSQILAGGSYKLHVRVKDLVTGTELTHDEPFWVKRDEPTQ